MEFLRCPVSAFLFPAFCFIIFFIFFPWKEQNYATHFPPPLVLSTIIKDLNNHTNIITSPSPSPSPSPSLQPPPLLPLELLSNFTPANESYNNTTVLSSTIMVRNLKVFKEIFLTLISSVCVYIYDILLFYCTLVVYPLILCFSCDI